MLDVDVKNHTGQIFRHYDTPSTCQALSFHMLIKEFSESGLSTACDFFTFCTRKYHPDLLKLVQMHTVGQSAVADWFKIKYGKVTASNFYACSRCKTPEGSLTEVILGARSVAITRAMQRGLLLEDAIKRVVERKLKIKFRKSGFAMRREFPAYYGATADAETNTHVAELKATANYERRKYYITEANKPTPRFYAQIQLQMLMTQKMKGYFCVAHHLFEENKEVEIIHVNFDSKFVSKVMHGANKFWE